MCTFNVHLICLSPDSEFSAIVSSNIFCLFGPFFPSESTYNGAVYIVSRVPRCCSFFKLHKFYWPVFKYINSLLIHLHCPPELIHLEFLYHIFLNLYLVLLNIFSFSTESIAFGLVLAFKPSFSTCLKIPSCETHPRNQSCCCFCPDGGSVETEVSKTAGLKW